jgi:hypothetical protein
MSPSGNLSIRLNEMYQLEHLSGECLTLQDLNICITQIQEISLGLISRALLSRAELQCSEDSLQAYEKAMKALIPYQKSFARIFTFLLNSPSVKEIPFNHGYLTNILYVIKELIAKDCPIENNLEGILNHMYFENEVPLNSIIEIIEWLDDRYQYDSWEKELFLEDIEMHKDNITNKDDLELLETYPSKLEEDGTPKIV